MSCPHERDCGRAFFCITAMKMIWEGWMMKKNLRSMRRYTIAALVTAAACLASGCAKKEVSVEVVSGAENELSLIHI